MGEKVIGTLARNDFVRTKALTNQIERTELRVLVKMTMLRTHLSNKVAAQVPAVPVR
ncbi:MAG: hypothetical protein ABR530_02415 [Pyrinomonadaceae bacterium]